MKDKIVLSIILPIYNVQEYLVDCIESILDEIKVEQHGIEVLLIDDGSTDKSGSICDNYKKKNENIRVFHKENGGLSDARNYGLIKSKGDYVWFVDSDDMIQRESVSTILECINKFKKVDVFLGNSIIVDDEGKENKNVKYKYVHNGLEVGKIYSGVSAIENQIDACDNYQTTVWLGIYRREFLVQDALFFEKGLLHEDEMWTPKVLIDAKSVVYIGKQIYKYRIRGNSIMRQDGDCKKHVEAFIYIFSTLSEYYELKIKEPRILLKIKDNLSKRYLHDIVYWRFYRYPYIYKRINKKRILKDSKRIKNVIRATILCLNKYVYSYVLYNLENKKR